MLKRKRDIACINSPSYQIEEKSRSSSSSSISEESIEVARSEVSSPEFHDSHSPLSNMQPPKSFSIQPGKMSFNFVNPVKRRKIESSEESEIKSITSSTTTTTSSSSIVSQTTMSEMKNQSILFSAKKYKPESAIKQINYPPKIVEYSDNSPVPPILLSTRKNTTYKVEQYKEIKKDENIITVNNKEYLKKKEVGKGGSGHVYEVTTSRNEILALKIIEIKSEEERKCIKSEIEYLEKFRGNKYIIQLIDYQITHDKIYIVYIYLFIYFYFIIDNGIW